MEARTMVEASANPQAFRWSRVATMAVVLLIHAGFVILLLLPAGAWRWRGTTRAPRSDALSLRFMALPSVLPLRPRAKVLPHVHATTPMRRPMPVVSVVAPKPQPRLAVSASVPSASADDIRSAQPSYIAGGGRFATDSGFTRDNVHLPGSAQPVHGMPVFHMVDPQMQGIAGAVRTVQKLFGIPDSHCVDVDVWRAMTTSERIAKHIDDERIDETAARYHCRPG
jgi:hypothetical protein